MAVHPLRPATDRRLGGPLPRQPANQTRAHPAPPEFSTLLHAKLCAYAVLAAVSGCCPPVRGRLPTRYSPVRHWAAPASAPEGPRRRAPFDLHVLGTPPAFILSQDQTLMFISFLQPGMLLASSFPCSVRSHPSCSLLQALLFLVLVLSEFPSCLFRLPVNGLLL